MKYFGLLQIGTIHVPQAEGPICRDVLVSPVNVLLFLLKDNKYTWNEDPDVDEKIVMIVIPPSACKGKMRGSVASRLHSNNSLIAVCRSYGMFVSQEVK